ncbi:hypothetical protein [Niallia nealsonii]|uniref:hypothetical protein n=1 Tax=Niallia nealsonii TaxID=115979 RepID=UPI001444F147|nr:hypothetical protein [Niallia nealsonii]
MNANVFSLLPFLLMVFIYLIPVALIIFAVLKFYKLLKEKNEILREIATKLEIRNK